MSAKYRQRLLQSSGVSNTKFESEYAKKLMSQMGWKEGNGLGKKQQGSTECVQIRRRDDGLGLGVKNQNEPTNWKDEWWNDMYNKSIKKMSVIPAKLKKVNKKKQQQSSSSSSDDSSDDSSSSDDSPVHLPSVKGKHKNITKKAQKSQKSQKKN